MSTKEERDAQIGEAMIDKIKAETKMLNARALHFEVETELIRVKTDHAKFDLEEWLPVLKKRYQEEGTKFIAERAFYVERAEESREIALSHRNIREFGKS